MGLFGPSKTEKIAFFNSKIAPWTTNAVAIGTTSGAMTALAALLATAQSKMAAQVAAQAGAKTATAACDTAVDALVVAGMDVVKSIRTKAATGGPDVYELAEIPAPATPTPVNTLGMPSNFTAALDASGALTLSWKCASPRASGVVYQVWRRTTATGQFEYLGGTGGKQYVDATIPAGSSQITYQIQAVRSTAAGPWATYLVQFGTSSSGQTVESVTETPMKKAA